MIEEIGHDLLQHPDLIPFGIEIQEPALFGVGKLVNPGEVIEDGSLQKLLDLSLCAEYSHPEKTRPWNTQASVSDMRLPGEHWKAERSPELLFCDQLALHCADLRGIPLYERRVPIFRHTSFSGL